MALLLPAARSTPALSLPDRLTLAAPNPEDGPVILHQPLDVTLRPGESVELHSGARGVGLLRFQWYFNDAPLAGEIGPSLVLNAVAPGQSGAYWVRVTDALGAMESRRATVTVSGAPLLPSWRRHPVTQTVAVGATARLEAAVDGEAPITFQWRLNGNAIPGATNAFLDIPAVLPSDGGRYSLVASNPRGRVESLPAVLHVALPLLALADRFADRLVIRDPSGVGSTLNTEATFDAALDEPRHAGKRGGRSVWLTWIPPESGRASLSTAGSSFDTLLAVYTGDSTLQEWASDDDGGGFLTSAVAFEVRAGTAYHIAVDGFAGASGVVVLSWNLQPGAPPLPRILVPPTGGAFPAGTDATLAVAAEGANLAYQWRIQDQPLPDQTNATLILRGLTPSDAGDYRVRIRHPAGGETDSAPATVEVTSGPAAPARDKLDDLFPEPPAGAPGLLAPGASGFTSVAPGIPGWRETRNDGAFRSPNEPALFGDLGGASLWFRFRSTADGWMRLSTEGSAIPAVLGVFTNRTRLSPLAEARPLPPAVHSELIFGAAAGVDYLVCIDGVSGARGPIRLHHSLALASLDAVVVRWDQGAFVLEHPVPPGTYQVSSGALLADLQTVLTTNVSGGLLRFVDPGASQRNRRFYRITGSR